MLVSARSTFCPYSYSNGMPHRSARLFIAERYYTYPNPSFSYYYLSRKVRDFREYEFWDILVCLL
jgi:hypothetical protein